MFTAEQAAAGDFCLFETRHAFVKKVRFSQYLFFDNICQYLSIYGTAYGMGVVLS